METDHDRLIRMDAELNFQTQLLKKMDKKLDKNEVEFQSLKSRVKVLEGAATFLKWVVSPILALVAIIISIYQYLKP